MLGRDRIEYKTPDQVPPDARARDWSSPTPSPRCGRAAASGRSTTGSRRGRGGRDRGRPAPPRPSSGYHGYPATLCVSVNDEVVHGIPGARVIGAGRRRLRRLRCDRRRLARRRRLQRVVPRGRCAADARPRARSRTRWMPTWCRSPSTPCGTASRRSRWGERLDDVGGADRGLGGRPATGSWRSTRATASVPRCTRPPDVLNYRTRDRGPGCGRGLCVAIEPMLTRGDAATQVLDDDWTVVTGDGRAGRALGAHGRPARRRPVGADGPRRRRGRTGLGERCIVPIRPAGGLSPCEAAGRRRR